MTDKITITREQYARAWDKGSTLDERWEAMVIEANRREPHHKYVIEFCDGTLSNKCYATEDEAKKWSDDKCRIVKLVEAKDKP